MPVTLTLTIIQFPTGGMTDRYLDKTEVVSVIYYSDNKQTCTATHMFIFLQLHWTRHNPPTTRGRENVFSLLNLLVVHVGFLCDRSPCVTDM